MYKFMIGYILSFISILLLTFVCTPLVLMGVLTTDQLWLYTAIGLVAASGIFCIIGVINLLILCIKGLVDKDDE